MNYGIHSEFLNKTVCPFFCADTICGLCDNLPALRSLIRLIIKNNPLGKFVHWWVAKSPFSADWQIFGENGCRECGGRNRAGRISSKSCFVFSPFLGRICKLRPPLLRVKRKWSAWHMRKYDKQAKLIRSNFRCCFFMKRSSSPSDSFPCSSFSASQAYRVFFSYASSSTCYPCQ